jgi:rhamnulokinase
VFERVPRAELFARTGIQLMQINTVFQLFAHARRGLPTGAAHLLMIPDLMAALLTGRTVTEFSIGTTTQLFDATTGTWDEEIIRRLDLPRALFSADEPSGTILRPLLPEVTSETALTGTCMVAPAAHDTGSAVAGAPLQPRWAYVSSGTWSLVGVERDRVLIGDAVARHNFTNEGGACGTIRFLKNVMGLWILESCRQEWRERGARVDYDELLRQASSLEAAPALIFPDDPRFLNPPGMLAAIAEQMAESGQVAPQGPPDLTRVILDSLAFRYASVLRTIEALTSVPIEGVHIVGGGSQNHHLNQATATATGKTVLAGPIEATAIGNAVVQAISAGRFASLADGRSHVERHVRPVRFVPQPTPAWERAARLYAELEARFS